MSVLLYIFSQPNVESSCVFAIDDWDLVLESDKNGNAFFCFWKYYKFVSPQFFQSI